MMRFKSQSFSIVEPLESLSNMYYFQLLFFCAPTKKSMKESMYYKANLLKKRKHEKKSNRPNN